MLLTIWNLVITVFTTWHEFGGTDDYDYQWTNRYNHMTRQLTNENMTHDLEKTLDYNDIQNKRLENLNIK